MTRPASRREALERRVAQAAARVPFSHRPITLNVSGDLTAARLRGMSVRLRAAPHAPVLLRIASPGGLARETLAVARLLAARHGPTRAVAVGLVGSAAVLLFLGCREREAAAGSRFVVHGVAAGGPPQAARRLTREVLVRLADAVDSADREVAAFLAARTTASPARIASWMAGPDITLCPRAAFLFGLLTQVPPPPPLPREAAALAAARPWMARAPAAALRAYAGANRRSGYPARR